MQTFEKLRLMDRIGIRVGELPITLCVGRLNPLHLGKHGTSLLRSSELTQGGCQRSHHDVHCAFLQRTFGVANRLLVIAEVIMRQSYQTEAKGYQRVSRRETQTARHGIEHFGKLAGEETDFAESEIAKREVRIEFNRPLSRSKRTLMLSSD